ncbi:MAG: hypothetical protein Q4G66_00935 [bacterium]|nr:hypothetical protein [bacterium]
MQGTIFSDQKCPLCGRSFVYTPKAFGLICLDHPSQRAHSSFIVQFGRKLRKRFRDFASAERFLTGIRYEVDRGTFDVRDYQASNPLSFVILSEQWLEKQRNKVKAGTYQHQVHYIRKAQAFFGKRNVKTIQFAELEDFIDSLSVSSKTKHNYLSCLHTFFSWLLRRKEISRAEFPDFPTVQYELGFRNTIDKESQQAIIEEVRRISWHVSPKIWLGIKWLSTYISIRPGELRNILEKDIDLRQGIIIIPHPKEKKPKFVPLIESDIELLAGFPRSLSHLFFFRHQGGFPGVTPGSRFGERIFYTWWKRACSNLGVNGVDLYGGTRHSSAVSLRDVATPEEIRRCTMHSTNKAFERYLQVSRQELQRLYELAARDTSVIPIEQLYKRKQLK